MQLKIKKYRLENNLSQKELADKMNVKQSYISRLENGISVRTFTLGKLKMLGEIFDICPLDLIECSHPKCLKE